MKVWAISAKITYQKIYSKNGNVLHTVFKLLPCHKFFLVSLHLPLLLDCSAKTILKILSDPVVSDCGRRGGLMVSALDSGSNGLGSSPGWGHCVVFLSKALNTLIVLLSTQVYKWGNPAMD